MGLDDLLYALVAVFERLDVRYFVTGSVATMTYGEPRFTNDVDIVADLQEQHVDAFCEAFPPPGFYLSRVAVLDAVRACGQFNLLHISEGVKADIFLPSRSEFDQSRLARCRPVSVGARGEAILASPEDAILKKMEYFREGGSEKHLRDIAGVLKICPHPIDRSYIEHWAAKLEVLDIWNLILERVDETTEKSGEQADDEQDRP